MKSLRTSWYLWLVGIVLAGYPLVSSLPLIFNVESRIISMSYRACALGYCLLLIGYYVKAGRLHFGWFGVAYLVFWTLYSLRLFFETSFNPYSLSQPVYVYYLFAFLVTLLPSLACFVRLQKWEVVSAARIAWCICFIAALLVNLTFWLGDSGMRELYRFSLETLNPISAGSLGATLALLSACFLRVPSWRSRAMGIIGFGAGLALLLMASSRGAIIAFSLALLVLVAAPLIRRRGVLSIRHLQALILLLFMSSIAAIPLLQYVEDQYAFSTLSGLRRLGTADDMSGLIRQQSYSGAWEQFMESPLLGDALEERSTGFYPHNNILEAFMATGVIGGSLLLCLYLVSLVNFWRLIWYRNDYSWIGVIGLQLLILSLSSGVIWGSAALFCLMALASQSIGVVHREFVRSVTSGRAVTSVRYLER